MGADINEATRELVKAALRAGLIPTINGMSAAGLVALPGMMTGQILAGADPTEAVKYQIIIWFFIVAGVGFGMAMALRMLEMRLFDERQRLRLDRLVGE